MNNREKVVTILIVLLLSVAVLLALGALNTAGASSLSCPECQPRNTPTVCPECDPRPTIRPTLPAPTDTPTPRPTLSTTM